MAQPEVVKDIDARVKIAGDTMTGNLKGKYFQGTWLQTTSASDLGSSPSKIAVISNDGWIYYRTPSELASDIGLTGNYVLKSGDTMTGNLTAPTFIGSLQGNASSSTYSTYTYFRDTRNDNEMPLDMLKGISLHLKSNSTDGISDGLSYHPVLMLRDWNDLSGGPFAELTITGNQNLYFRSSTTNADNTWNPWRKVLTDYNYTSILNNTYLPLSGGTMSGTIFYSTENTGKRIIAGSLRNSGIKYDYAGRESLIISAGTYANAGISFYTANELNMSDGNGQWNTVSPSVHILKKSLAINYNMTADPSYNFYVNGTSYFNGDISGVGNIYPLTDNSKNLGSSSLKWANVYATTFNGSLSGNATTATKLKTARTISLSGAVTGSGTFDGSANLDIVTTIGNVGPGSFKMYMDSLKG